uniref:Uncharacterized protein n=1 Tax=Anopheles atroparvus TaxID=41427 RepID=A0AAG5CZG5_ANOAO
MLLESEPVSGRASRPRRSRRVSGNVELAGASIRRNCKSLSERVSEQASERKRHRTGRTVDSSALLIAPHIFVGTRSTEAPFIFISAHPIST